MVFVVVVFCFFFFNFTQHATLPQKCEYSGRMSHRLSHQRAVFQSQASVSPWAEMK